MRNSLFLAIYTTPVADPGGTASVSTRTATNSGEQGGRVATRPRPAVVRAAWMLCVLPGSPLAGMHRFQ